MGGASCAGPTTTVIPSGAAHTEMILEGNEVSGEMDDEAKALV